MIYKLSKQLRGKTYRPELLTFFSFETATGCQKIAGVFFGRGPISAGSLSLNGKNQSGKLLPVYLFPSESSFIEAQIRLPSQPITVQPANMLIKHMASLCFFPRNNAIQVGNRYKAKATIQIPNIIKIGNPTKKPSILLL
jgi:hypothetical protein